MTDPTIATLEGFFRAVRGTNPFRANRVSSPEDMQIDVVDVHGREFKRLLKHLEPAPRPGPSTGIMLLGSSGVGKSHLLARLYSWAKQGQSIEYVYLHNLQASPERIARYVLKATVSSILGFNRNSYSAIGLFTFLNSVLPAPKAGQRPAELVRSMCEEKGDLEIFTVLFAFQEALEDPDARELCEAAQMWLSGDEIDEEHAARLSALGGSKIGTLLPDVATVERAMIVLARLLQKTGRTLVLCLDQVDNLDEDQITRLMAFLHALLDHADNLAVICSGVTSTMINLRDAGVIPEAAWDRVALYRVELQEIAVAEARALLEARLRAFLAPFVGLSAIANEQRRDALFPLGEPWLKTRLAGSKQVRPRDVITWARDAWAAQQERLDTEGGLAWLARWRDAVSSTGSDNGVPEASLAEATDSVVRAKLREREASRELEPNSLPPDADNLATLTRKLLDACLNQQSRGYSLSRWERPKAQKKGGPSTYDLVVHEQDGHGRPATTGLVFLAHGHGNATTAQLRRLTDDKAPPNHVLVTTDERRPLRLGAKGETFFDDLARRGAAQFRHVQLNLKEVVTLDALVSVLALAKVGDLEVEHPRGVPRPLSHDEVTESLHRLDAFRAHPLLHELLSEDVAPPVVTPDVQPLADPHVREGIAAYLSWRAGASATEVARKLADDHGVTYEPTLLQQVIRVADGLHREGKLKAQPQDEDRFLWWVGGSA